ncbi:PTS lactose/cellobiose transporter subunit IIA [Vagococcus sp. BWB3-3]|uniref:PTS lactose/cellobiose transporter subunit IIA n=1 Tax=Vagococcus allomyrinae TaxID=2794353 RepID=A0A940SVE8_9ENTE|nr:PTS lactose/cellobiose transporter subunit IIA [Vagococcus allomyrinae]MBP1041006.1 PTS lactose/cellobiose transporter subunit IIA [Vagococcus allomyrinae]
MEKFRKEDLVQISMEMILHAGDARTALMLAYDLLEEDQLVEAESKMKEANDLLTKAHKCQTKVVQSEAAGISIEYSPLFSHAQDTMMTVQSQYILSKKIFKLYLKQTKGREGV